MDVFWTSSRSFCFSKVQWYRIYNHRLTVSVSNLPLCFLVDLQEVQRRSPPAKCGHGSMQNSMLSLQEYAKVGYTTIKESETAIQSKGKKHLFWKTLEILTRTSRLRFRQAPRPCWGECLTPSINRLRSSFESKKIMANQAIGLPWDIVSVVRNIRNSHHWLLFCLTSPLPKPN